ncbi:putative molybdopterin biosynthesis protein MoeA/LysR substrate binding-domain-containing protein [Jannaschia seosinensis]|uniref:Putative molybdopterin biosynthesis protein MoeA/LysR substrate binding-domain-containing protein n=1 Tax=Jannaschia seosinensis TaxID=313367 RepID=A0A0M7B9M2_9RHOB|nr:helix-turn-helix transcriptional regulator [Jannaschia seosinensis]CUH39061.1 putative molybdopterin biosynthesis protein MoeA/LysR substrate binding-domain-containing protein [Jannaschia seosinensis]
MTDDAFPDHEYLTVKELAVLLRLKDRKVYDLAASGAVPCSRATGKLLFPATEIREWIERAKSGGDWLTTKGSVTRPPILLGSHDPLLDWAIRQSGCGLATYYDGSLDGLDRFVRGDGVAAGVHIHDAKSGDWNVPAVSRAARGLNAVLVSFAIRRRGLVFRSGEPAPSKLSDLVGRRIVPRQPGSGTDTLFRQLAAQEGLDMSALDFADVARTEDGAVEAVRRGEADAAFGIEAGAHSYGLEFLPLIEEQFALLVDRKAWFEPQVRKLISFCGTEPFLARARTYGGYDVQDLGAVVWNS